MGEDLDVLIELCDWILVLCGGKVSGIISGRGADKQEIGLMMTRVGGLAPEQAMDVLRNQQIQEGGQDHE